jgi:AcrR family transcriptional regulator
LIVSAGGWLFQHVRGRRLGQFGVTDVHVRSFYDVAVGVTARNDGSEAVDARRVPSAMVAADGGRGLVTRARIEAEALLLFERQGFRTTTMREITSACGITPAAFYNHFPSKDELLLSIVLSTFADLEDTVELAMTALPDDCGARERLLRTVEAMTEWHYRNLSRAQVSNREVLELPVAMLRKVHDRRRKLRQLIEGMIAAGIADGELNMDYGGNDAPDLASSAILGIIQAFPRRYIESGDRTPEDMARFVGLAVLRMVGVPGAIDTPAV